MNSNSTTTKPTQEVRLTQNAALLSLLLLIVLCVAWEGSWAPLKPGGSWLALKALPLLFAVPGIFKRRLYTYRWLSLVIWLYFIEGVVRAYSDVGDSARLAGLETALSVLLFMACAGHVRARFKASLLAPEPPHKTPSTEPAFSQENASKAKQFQHSQPLIEELKTLLGPQHVLTAPLDLMAYEQDWRKRSTGRSLCVVRPASTLEVSQVVKACARRGVSIVPQGGNTGLVVGSTPDESGQQVLLSLQRMKAVRAVYADNLSIDVEAGCVLAQLQEAASAAGLFFPLSLGSEGSCTIGGNLSTNAGGTQVLRYGNARDLCLGLEVVLANGEILQGLSGLRKDNTGYDLKNLFIGSEGTLGIITAASLKLFPRPQSTLNAWAALNSLEDCVLLLGLAHEKLGAGLSGFEVMNQYALGLVGKHFPTLKAPFQAYPWCALMELSDNESHEHAHTQLLALLELAMEQGCVQNATVAENLSKAAQMWHIRESITLAQAQEGLNVKHDISLSAASIPAFVEQTDRELTELAPGSRLINFGHLGDGNLHYNVQGPEDTNSADFLRDFESPINDLVHRNVFALGGSISAEHGIGSLKVDTLPHYKDPQALALMRRLKNSLDPENILNPGRVIRMSPHA
jgi:FAD/FMN-containing dehydrogenase/uncharacterized membrane protein